MKGWNAFSSENVFISVAGHLTLAAIILTSFSVVVDRARTVAPDRVEITEIDLSAVRVSGDETRLVNTTTPPPPPEPVTPTEFPPAPAPDVTPDDAAEHDTPTDTAVVDDAPPSPDVTPAPVVVPDAPAPDDTPRPKKKTVVRVNREVRSLDRTMTVSVTDALRVALTRCWVIDTTRPDIADIRAVARLTMNKNGMVRDIWFESARRAENDPAFAYVLDTIRDALAACQPFRMLPVGEFETWEKIELTFYPTQGKIM